MNICFLSDLVLEIAKMCCQLLDQIRDYNGAGLACNFLHKLLHGVKVSMAIFITYVAQPSKHGVGAKIGREMRVDVGALDTTRKL